MSKPVAYSPLKWERLPINEAPTYNPDYSSGKTCWQCVITPDIALKIFAANIPATITLKTIRPIVSASHIDLLGVVQAYDRHCRAHDAAAEALQKKESVEKDLNAEMQKTNVAYEKASLDLLFAYLQCKHERSRHDLTGTCIKPTYCDINPVNARFASREQRAAFFADLEALYWDEIVCLVNLGITDEERNILKTASYTRHHKLTQLLEKTPTVSDTAGIPKEANDRKYS
jgi:hypothetical protein